MNEMPPDELVDGTSRALTLLRERLGECVNRLGEYDAALVERIAGALARHGEGAVSPHAHDVAFHLTDWVEEAAFILALRLFPDRFTPEEIADGIACFLLHVPNHVAAAAVLAGHPPEDIFGVSEVSG